MPVAPVEINPRLQTKLNERKQAIRRGVLRFAELALRDYPWRAEDASPYQVLVYEFLLRRTHAKTVAANGQRLLDRFPNPDSLARARLQDLQELLAPIGLQHQRSKELKALAQFLIEHHAGRVPATLEDLLALPGVGPYTARAVMCFGWGKPHAIVDSNVLRVYSRVFRSQFDEPTSVPAMQRVADQLLPRRRHKEYNLALLDLGAGACNYRQPQCHECPLSKACDVGHQFLR